MAERIGALSDRECLQGLIVKQWVPFLMLVGFGFLIYRQASHLDFAAIFQTIDSIRSAQWAVAVVAAAVSFWAIGRMDAVVHRMLATGMSDSAAQMSGIASVATAQLTGFGLLTGTLARWRVLKTVSLWDAAKITGSVSVGFMLALAALTSIMVIVVNPALPMARPVAIVAFLALLVLCLATVWRPRFLFNTRLPPLNGQFALLMCALLDTVAAAATLYVLIPAAVMPEPFYFYTIFLLALGAGLLGTTPGGVGPFEFLLILCLPTFAETELIAGIIAYRIVYFALPAVFATVILIFGSNFLSGESRSRPTMAPLHISDSVKNRPTVVNAMSFNANRAETGLLRQGEFHLLCGPGERPVSLAAETGQSLILFADPLGADSTVQATLRDLDTTASLRFRLPCLYKCSAEVAAQAKGLGWRVLRISQEAKIDTQKFDLSGSEFRQLRRQLRKADASGLKVVEGSGAPPIAAMQTVADAWIKGRAGERGFSVGRFDKRYVSGQRIFLAFQQDQLVGFVTFHESFSEWALDFMCHVGDAPNGTMHRLIERAITSAHAQGCKTVSLAAIPDFDFSNARLNQFAEYAFDLKRFDGLARFKSCFAPEWSPLYLTAPTWPGLILAGLDLFDRITRPRTNIEPGS